ESLLNRDTSIVFSPKFDSLLDEFSGELAHINLISPEIDEADFDPEDEIHAVIKSLSPSPIPVEDSNSLMEEIDIFLAPDDSIPSGIENDDYDSEGDILFLEELLSNDSLSLPENESFHFDHFYDPSPPRPPAKPPDDDGIHFDIEPDTGILTAKVVDDIFEHYVLMPSILTTHPTNCPVIDTLLPFSSENENKVFNSGILSSNEEKSPHLLFHQGFKAYQIIFDFSKSRIMIYGRDSTILDVPFLHSDSLSKSLSHLRRFCWDYILVAREESSYNGRNLAFKVIFLGGTCIGYSLKEKNESKADKTGHENGKSVKS
ncbi:hypothetical protein Tco_0642608, partial [Tanacetum coccineum]